MGNKSLLELSRQYAEGELNKPEYRQQRNHIINEITGEETLSESTMTVTDPGTIKIPRQTSTSAIHPTIKFVLLAIFFIVVIVVAYISMGDNGYHKNTKTSSSIHDSSRLTLT